MRKKSILFCLIAVLVLGIGSSALAELKVPKKKQTTLGLYVTAKQAFVKWHANPEKIHILDCRTPQEYVFVGHAPMAVNIPSMFMTLTFDAKKKSYKMAVNKDFVALVKKRFKMDDTIFIMCRSGGRSARSVNLLAKAGFKKAHNIIDGFEGDKVKDKGSYYNGKRLVNGWKNSGAPWTYHLNPDLVYLPAK